jgi:outer membrane immunogenic protein
MRRAFARCLGFVALLAGGTVHASDLPPLRYKAPPSPIFQWDGFYVGGHAGFAWGPNSTAALNLLGPTSPVAGQVAEGAFGGAQAGYDWRLDRRLLVGVRLDISGAAIRSESFADAPTRDIKSNVPVFGTVRGRVGYLIDDILLYASAGVAAARVDVTRTQIAQTVNFATPGTVEHNAYTGLGYAGGVGFEYALGRHWSFDAEYLYQDFGAGTYLQPLSVIRTTRHIRGNVTQLGVNFRF